MAEPRTMRLWVTDLPADPLDAAADFHARFVPQVRALIAESPDQDDSLVVILPLVDQSHHAWRLAVVQELAREAAPVRVNAVAGGNASTIIEVAEWLDDMPGVTGQLLAVDGHSPENRA